MDNSPQVVDVREGSLIETQRARYKVIRELGEGGFGNVYSVKNENGDLAMKLTKLWTFMPNERLEYAKRFRQEYDYGSKLKSNFVVRSYDFDVMNGNPFIIMDLCPNGSLRDLVKKPLSEAELDKLAFGILRGLEDLHSEGIIHRDIKPENVLFDQVNRPRLADFGISASVKKRHTMANFMGHAKTVFATGTYSPPEQIDPKKAMKVMGPTNDIYAFGAMMYELITDGELPFGGFDEFMGDMAGYERKKKEEKWNRQALSKSAPSEKWEAIISKCIRYKPEDRYQNIEELQRDFGFELRRSSQFKIIDENSQWVLQVKNGEEIGREYNLTNLLRNKGGGVLTVGWFNPEDPFTNDIGITEFFTEFISGYHATFIKEQGENRWLVRDGQFREKNGNKAWYPSTNGILVNGKRPEKEGAALQPDDIITIGDTTLKVLIK